MKQAGETSFLVVRLGSLGDLMHTLPAVAALRAAFPGARIDWVVEEKWTSLVELAPAVNSVIALRRSLEGWRDCVRRLRAVRYARAVDFQGLYKSALLAVLSGAPQRIGFDARFAREPGASWFYTQAVAPAGRHVSEMNRSLAAMAGAGVKGGSSEMKDLLRLPAEEESAIRERLARENVGDFVLISPGGGWRSKCWPPKRYGALCAELWRRCGIVAVVNCGPGEEPLAHAVVTAAVPARPVVVSPTLRELVALAAQARVVVAADTGPLHLAAVLGTRVVALFGPTDPARNGPIPRGTVLRNVSGDSTTYKRERDYSPAMLALSVEEVTAAVEQELGVGS